MKINSIKSSHPATKVINNQEAYRKSAYDKKDKFIGKEGIKFFQKISQELLSEKDLIINVASPISSRLPRWWSIKQENALPQIPLALTNFSEDNSQLLAKLKTLASDKSYLEVYLFDVG